MLLGDPDIEGAAGEFLREEIKACAPGIAAVIATTFSSFSASRIRAWANTFV
jgi:hypothetical protein